MGTSFNYVAKYSNPKVQENHEARVFTPLDEGDEVDIIALHILPGKAYKCGGVLGGVPRCFPGYTSHISTEGNEYWLPFPNQSIPRYIIRVKGYTAGNSGNDDGIDDAGDLKYADVRELQEIYDFN